MGVGLHQVITNGPAKGLGGNVTREKKMAVAPAKHNRGQRYKTPPTWFFFPKQTTSFIFGPRTDVSNQSPHKSKKNQSIATMTPSNDATLMSTMSGPESSTLNKAKKNKKDKKEKKHKKEKKDKKAKKDKKEKKDKKRKRSLDGHSSESTALTTTSTSAASGPIEASDTIPSKKHKGSGGDVDALMPNAAKLASASVDVEKKKDKKKKKKKEADEIEPEEAVPSSPPTKLYDDPKIVASSSEEGGDVCLLLFYQYVEPAWDSEIYRMVLQRMEENGNSLNLGGRMRVAKEGLNCTLSGTEANIRLFCRFLRNFHKGEFANTEFKLTTDLPSGQHFSNGLKVMPVNELVHYGLDGAKAPPLQNYAGTHLDPQDYHQKLVQDDTIVIDVRNHYEAVIGHFDVPTWVDPKMRKSTEFPVWLDKDSTKDRLRNKQVLMYCTGGVRCERASALLKYKLDRDPTFSDLNIKGVYQLQGGIDKYFKEFPDGGHWKGKNYTFDKRYAHTPTGETKKTKDEAKETTVTTMTTTTTATDGATQNDTVKGRNSDNDTTPSQKAMGKCEACRKPWDKYRGKRRCPTCGVPSLICRDCYLADQSGQRKLGRAVRCDLCVEEGIRSKQEVREREQRELEEYKRSQQAKGLTHPQPEVTQQSPSSNSNSSRVVKTRPPAPNPNNVTRLLLKNMCRRNMDETTLMETIPGITHIVWRTDRLSGQFFGSGWVEMATPDDAAVAVAMNGKRVLGRPLYVEYQPPDPKDLWPPPSSAVRH